MDLSSSKSSSPLKNQRGQVVVEYVLLLMAVVMIASLITRTMVRRDPESPGFLIGKWARVVDVIAKDVAE